MTDFIIREREYPELPQLILEGAPDFGESDEYAQLNDLERSLPGVVAGAFRRYLSRLHSDPSAADRDPLHARRLEDVHGTLERLAQSEDPEVVNAVVTEVYEHLDLPAAELDAFRAHLRPAAAALYERWIDDPPS